VVGFAILVLGGGTASAHAQLEGSDPVAGDVLAVAPSQVTLTFGEPVEFAATAIRVFDDHLRGVSTGRVTALDRDGNRLRVALRSGLARGTYTVSWDVSSDDTHPVSGSFRFSIGAPSTVTGGVDLAARNDTAGLLLGITRGAGYAGLALGPGLLLVVCLLWRPGLGDRRTRRLLYAGLTLLALSAMGEMLLQGVWASGRPLSAIWSSPETLDTRSHRFDQLHAVRLYLLVAFGIAVAATLSGQRSRPLPSTPPSRARGAAHQPSARTGRATKSSPRTRSILAPQSRPLVLWGAAVTSAALMSTWSLAGHSAIGDLVPLAVVVNLAHLVAMTLWLGGLALVAVILLPADRRPDLVAVLPRFSRLAFACVAVLVVSGTYLAWREVGSLGALTTTEYGRVLLVKLQGVLAIIVLGNLARHWVQRHLSLPNRRRIPFGAAGVVPATAMTFRPLEYGQPELRRLRWGILAELVIATVVLALTTALVVIVPAHQDVARPFHKVVRSSGLIVVLDSPTPRVGDMIMRVKVTTADGRPQPVTALTGSISLASPPIGPLPVRMRPAGGASSSGIGEIELSLPARGEWTVRLSVKTSPIDATALSTRVPVS
jgi:copper transport protein